jgi:hypothetical protein
MSIIQIKILKNQITKLSDGFKNKYLGKIICVNFSDLITNKKITDIEIGEAVDCNILYRKEFFNVKCEVILCNPTNDTPCENSIQHY